MQSSGETVTLSTVDTHSDWCGREGEKFRVEIALTTDKLNEGERNLKKNIWFCDVMSHVVGWDDDKA